MTFYGLADYRLSGSELGEVIEFYLSRDEADQAPLRGTRRRAGMDGQFGVEMVELPVSLQ